MADRITKWSGSPLRVLSRLVLVSILVGVILAALGINPWHMLFAGFQFTGEGLKPPPAQLSAPAKDAPAKNFIDPSGGTATNDDPFANFHFTDEDHFANFHFTNEDQDSRYVWRYLLLVAVVVIPIWLIRTKPETVKHHLQTIATALRQKLQITNPNKIKLLQMAVTGSWVLGSGWFAVERTLNPQSFQASIELNEHPIASIIGALIPTVVLAPLVYWTFGRTVRRIAARSVQRLQITRPDRIELLQSTSKLRAVLGAAILIVATATVTTIVLSKWNVFPPADYEDCAARAAKDAKTKEALSVLLSLCNSDFKGRRMPGGGYAYHNSCWGRSDDIGGTYTIKGPNPTPDEQKNMKLQCSADIEAERRASEQRAEEARKVEQGERAAAAAAASALQLRKSQTIPAVQVKANSLKCTLEMNRDRSCAMDLIDLQVEVTNRSKEKLSSVSIGVVSSAGICPSSYAVTRTLLIPLSPGETRDSLMLRFLDAAPLRLKNLCIQVVDVEFAG